MKDSVMMAGKIGKYDGEIKKRATGPKVNFIIVTLWVELALW